MTEMEEKKKSESTDLLQLVSFKLDAEEFGIDISVVQEIIKMVQITKVPNSPYYVDGIINLRGRVIPVIDLRVRIGLGKVDHTKDTRIIVIDLQGKTFGFIVDSVNEVLRISTDIIEKPPELVNGINSDYIKAVGKLEDRFIILIDLDKTIDSLNNKAA